MIGRRCTVAGEGGIDAGGIGGGGAPGRTEE